MEREEQSNLWRKERSELQIKVQDLITGGEKGRSDRERQLDKYRTKSSQYKQKLRLSL